MGGDYVNKMVIRVMEGIQALHDAFLNCCAGELWPGERSGFFRVCSFLFGNCRSVLLGFEDFLIR